MSYFQWQKQGSYVKESLNKQIRLNTQSLLTHFFQKKYRQINIKIQLFSNQLYLSVMKEKINTDNDCFDPSEEYFKKKEDTYENEPEEYFPQETSKPPHY